MLTWLIGIGLWGLAVLFVWTLCAVAGRADEAAARLSEDRNREVR